MYIREHPELIQKANHGFETSTSNPVRARVGGFILAESLFLAAQQAFGVSSHTNTATSTGYVPPSQPVPLSMFEPCALLLSSPCSLKRSHLRSSVRAADVNVTVAVQTAVACSDNCSRTGASACTSSGACQARRYQSLRRSQSFRVNTAASLLKCAAIHSSRSLGICCHCMQFRCSNEDKAIPNFTSHPSPHL